MSRLSYTPNPLHGSWTPQMKECYAVQGNCSKCSVGRLGIAWKSWHVGKCNGWDTVQYLLKEKGKPDKALGILGRR